MIGLIPARRGSKRIPGKALKLIQGKPLIQYTFEAAEKSNLNKYYLTSDYSFNELEKVIDLKEFNKLEIIERPENMAKSDSPINLYLDHAIDRIHPKLKFSSICLLQPTCPLRTYTDINKAIEIYNGGSLPGLVSAYRIAKGQCYQDNFSSLFKDTIYNKDDIIYVRNSSIYIFDLIYYLKHRTIFVNPTHVFEMDMARSIDINTQIDIDFCEKML